MSLCRGKSRLPVKANRLSLVYRTLQPLAHKIRRLRYIAACTGKHSLTRCISAYFGEKALRPVFDVNSEAVGFAAEEFGVLRGDYVVVETWT